MGQLYILTKKDLIKLSLMAVTSVILFGITGLLILTIFQWITLQDYSAERIEKHGISQVSASRLGGVAIFVCWLGVMLATEYSGYVDGNLFGPSGPHFVYWITVFSCAFLGFVEDVNNNFLSPRFRLITQIVIFSVTIYLWPFLIPTDLGIPGIDALISMAGIGPLITIFFCVGFVNAVNIADGANGLMPGMMIISFWLFHSATNEFVYAALMTVCAVFTLFNLISGRLFLGDAGSYGLGALLAISGLYLFNTDIFSAAFLACLFAYPCVDLVVSVIRRSLAGRPIFLPDNDHLHNRVHFHFQKWFKSKTLANSMTGLMVIGCSSGLALIGYLDQWWLATEDYWLLLFAFQLILYAIVFYLAGVKRDSMQYVVK
jgi:UDP-N-acetylmuramyl pentapeptide phosphotransferase/UDP-N-acetylglucosamine-1-phosphate transferase